MLSKALKIDIKPIFEGAKKLHCSKIVKKEQDEQDSTHGNYSWQ